MRRVCLLVMLLGAMIVPFGSSVAAKSLQTAESGTLDVPAVVPNAAELSAAGFEGYTLTGTGFFSLADDVEFLANLLKVDPADVEEMFAETGRESDYLSVMTLLEDPGDRESALDRELQVSVYSFADEAGASEAYAFLSNEENDPGAEDERGGATFGEESELTRRAGEGGSVEGLPVKELELQFHSGRLVISASIFAYGEDADEPSVDDLDAVGALIEERVDAVLSGRTPGLTNLVPRFEEVEGTIPYVGYWMRDGSPVPIDRETPEDTEARIEGYVGATVYLSYQQQIVFGGDAYEDDFLYNNNLLEFESDEDAVEFVETSQERYEAHSSYVDLEVVEDAPEFGDASVVFERTTILNGEEWTRYQLNFAVGDIVTVAWIAQVEPDIVVPVEPLYELGEAQETCLIDGGCTGTIDVPAGIVDGGGSSDADAGDSGKTDFDIGRVDEDETPVADDDSTPVANGDDDLPTGDEVTYESPQYGYTLTYDPREWEVFGEDDDPDDAYDRTSLTPTSGIDGIVTLVGDPDYESDAMADCVADYAAGIEQGDGVSDVAEMRGEDGEEADRAWATYTYVLETDGGEIDAVRYIECRALDDVTVVVLQSSEESAFEDLSDAREALLEGLEA